MASSASSRSLGAALRKLRTQRDPTLTLEEVASHFDWHKAKLSRIERGLTAVTPRDVQALIDYYGVEDDALAQTMIRLARRGPHRNWYNRYSDVLPRQFTNYLGLEGEAVSLHAWQPWLMPGLVQTEAYARALVVAYRKGQDEDEAARRVEARMERQAILQGPDSPLLHAIIGESALHRRIGGEQVMREQLLRVAAVAEQPNIIVQVVPNEAGALMPEEGGFQILRFADDDPGDVVCIDLRTRSLYLDEASEAGRYRDAWEDVLAKAEPPSSSIRMIMAAAEGIGK